MIVSLLKSIVNQFNEDEQCGKCWKFVHARKDYSNLYEAAKDEKCCNHFLLEKYSVSSSFEIDSDTGISDLSYQDFQFEAFVGTQSDMDRAYDNELGNPSSEGKFEKYIEPIEDCIGSGFQSSLCDIVEASAITRWSYDSKINYKDTNYDGIYLKGTIRIYSR